MFFKSEEQKKAQRVMDQIARLQELDLMLKAGPAQREALKVKQQAIRDEYDSLREALKKNPFIDLG